jgi:tetratricopeptide (TPR) repeat protein
VGRFLKIALGLGFIAAALHLGAINNELTYDDHFAIERNPTTERPLDLPAHFTGGFWGPAYRDRDAAWRPLVTLSFAWNRAAHGVSPAGYHLVNVLLHGLVVVFLALLARALGLRDEYALAAAALFAVHPLHVDAIAAGVGRADVMLGALGIGALLAWERRRTALALALLAAALLSKEMAVALAPVMLWREVTRRESPSWRWALPLSVVAAWIGARLAVLGTLGGAHPSMLENPVAGAGIAAHLWAAGDSYWLSLQLFVAPVTLVADYSYATFVPGASVTAVLGLVALAMTAAATLWTARRAPIVSTALALWLAPFLIVSHLGPTLPMAFAERVLYLPTAGLCVLAAAGLARLADRPALLRPAAAVFAIACALFAVRSIGRVPDWRDDATLHAATAEDAPRNVKALSNAARMRAAGGDLPGALALAGRALAVGETIPVAHITAASLYVQAGDPQAAARHIARARELNPDIAEMTAVECAFAARYRPDLAVEPCLAATRAPYAQPEAYMFLAIAHDNAGDPAAADAAFQTAIGMAVNPDVTLAFNYGVFLLNHRRYDEARAMLSRAAELAPDRTDIQGALAAATEAAARQ